MLGPITEGLIDSCIEHFKNSDNREKILDLCVDPIVTYVKKKLKIYVVMTSFIFLLTLLFAILIFYLLLQYLPILKRFQQS